MSAQSYKDLLVWQKSINLVVLIYNLTSKLPKDEQYGLVSQMNRCAVSIPSNIAEGKQRNNKNEFRHFVGIARGSAAELETQLIICQRVFNMDIKILQEEVESLQKMLTALAQSLKQ